MTTEQENTTFSSRISFILAITGAAIGLGNIWMFPYLAGSNGGAIFVITYLLSILILGIPALLAEILIGRLGRHSPIKTLTLLAKEYQGGRAWKYLGVINALTLFMVLSFYSVVAGWSIAYLVFNLSGCFTNATTLEISVLLTNFLASPSQLLLYHSIFMLSTIVIVARGIKKGLEFASNIMMPALFLLLIFLVIYGCVTGNPIAALNFLFQYDLNTLNSQVLLLAIGQAFFTLAIGAGCMLVYGAYLPKNVNVASNILLTTIANAGVSILAGIAIFSIVFAHDLEPAAGPGLMFLVLPVAFSQMQYGMAIGAAFFILLIFAALTSSISLAEPLAIILIEKFKLSRIKATSLVCGAAWICGIGALLSFNVLKDFKVLSHFSIFDVLTETPTKILLPLGVLGYAIFAGFVIPKNIAQDNLNINNTLLFKLWLFAVKFIIPTTIVMVFLNDLIY